MKRRYTHFIFGLFFSLLLAACVGGKFQKRKYTKGIYREKTVQIKSDLSPKNPKTENNLKSEEKNNQHTNEFVEPEPYYPASTLNNENNSMGAEHSSKAENTYSTNNSDNPIADGFNPVKPREEGRFWEVEDTDEGRREGFIEQPMHNEFGFLGILLLILLALILPPLAVAIYDGFSALFWITLVLWLIGIGVGVAFFVGSGVVYLSGSLATILAILVVLGVFD